MSQSPPPSPHRTFQGKAKFFEICGTQFVQTLSKPLLSVSSRVTVRSDVTSAISTFTIVQLRLKTYHGRVIFLFKDSNVTRISPRVSSG